MFYISLYEVTYFQEAKDIMQSILYWYLPILCRKQMTHDSVTHSLAESQIRGYREENFCVTKATLYKETPTRGPARRAFVLLIYCII